MEQVSDNNGRLRFHRGCGSDAYTFLGAHPLAGEDGAWRFSVWAPNAAHVSLVGDFNGWNDRTLPMTRADDGIWEITVRGAARSGSLYKFAVWGRDGVRHLKGDPYAFLWEKRPDNAGVCCSLDGYRWGDGAWMDARKGFEMYSAPINIYEMHLGSWRRGEGDRVLTYEEIADRLIPYLKETGYNYAELLPVMEHPFDGSWGYQVSGYYAPTSRYGRPEGLMSLIDRLHQAGIGVILDWVPAHFPRDEVGLRCFDGGPLYEHPDTRRSEMPQWGTVMLDYSRPEVCSFMLSNADFWLRMYHADGLRCDAVSAMLYLDFGREGMGYLPNEHGGRENTDAVRFFRLLNGYVRENWPGVMMIAEESTAWPHVTGMEDGGLGFHFKWNMGWMNDTLSYIGLDPIYRRYHHQKLTFPMAYAFSERFILSLSHDEVVHGKRSLWYKQPGDDWQRFAGLKALLGYMMTQPGKKLLFMGAELGQAIEWRDYTQLDWFLLDNPRFAAYNRFVKDLNRLYLDYPALYRREKDWTGFDWLNVDDASRSVIAYMRRGEKGDVPVVAVINFTPVVYRDYRVALPGKGTLTEILCSDRDIYGGSGQYNGLPVKAEEVPCCGRDCSAEVVLPPLGITCFRWDEDPMNQVDI